MIFLLLAPVTAGGASAIVFTPEDVSIGTPSGHYLDGNDDQVYYWDSSRLTLTPVSGVDPAGLYEIDVIPPGQRANVMTTRVDTCPAEKNYCIAYGYALVGGNKVVVSRIHTDRCLSEPFVYDTSHVAGIPVMRDARFESVSGGCCGTIDARLFIQDRLRDSDSMFWRGSHGCP